MRHLVRGLVDLALTVVTALPLAGIRVGRIVTTLPEHRDRRRGPASREDSFYVYRRTGLPCRLCGTEVLGARNL